MQFLVLGYDGSDDGALARRMAARDAHLKAAEQFHKNGQWLYATAILNDAGTMVGSMIVCEFPSQKHLHEQWLDHEPYILGNVWQRIEIQRAQVAPFFQK